MYRSHMDDHIEPLGYTVDEPKHDIRYGETYGPTHHAEDHFEVMRQALLDQHKHDKTEKFVEPTYAYSGYHPGVVHREEATDAHFAPRTYTSREVEYEVDAHGHVHMFEAAPEYELSASKFLQ